MQQSSDGTQRNTPNAFEVDIADDVLVDLNQRLVSTRWPDEIKGIGWQQGTNLGYLQKLVKYWHEKFDWRQQERKLNELPQFRVNVDGLGLHFIHMRGKGLRPYPLILSHGWPGTCYELAGLISQLADPAAYGADPADAFDVVVPSLPGFGFSDRPSEQWVTTRVPELWLTLMRDILGYPRFGAHGGDLGAGITARLAMYHPQAISGIHVTNVYWYGSVGAADPPLTPAEQAHVAREDVWSAQEGAYGEIQGTRPQTLAYGLNDSPAGLAGWIIEKYRAWSDCDGDVEKVFAKDDLLTNVTIYWATQTINSSFRPYYEFRHNPVPRSWTKVDVPSAVALFPKDLGHPPREWAERSYNVQQWTEMPRGGHFAAYEQPQLLAEDIRRFFRRLR